MCRSSSSCFGFCIIYNTVIDNACIGICKGFFETVDEDSGGGIFDCDIGVEIFTGKRDVYATCDVVCVGTFPFNGLKTDAAEEFTSRTGDAVEKDDDGGTY